MTNATTAQSMTRMAVVAIIDANDAHVLAQLRSILPESSFRALASADDLAPATLPPSGQPGMPQFTSRQLAILELLKSNLSNKQIGRTLDISHFTVRNHVSQILRLLNVTSRRRAIEKVHQIGHDKNHQPSVEAVAADQ